MVVEDQENVSDMGRMAIDMLTRSMLHSMKATKHMATMLHRRFQPGGSVVEEEEEEEEDKLLRDLLLRLLLLLLRELEESLNPRWARGGERREVEVFLLLLLLVVRAACTRRC